MMYKIWEGGLNPQITYYLEKDSMDEAFAVVREVNPKVNTGQACTDEEAEEIRRGK